MEQTARTRDVMLNLLLTIAKRLQDLLEQLKDLMSETRHDAQQTQRLWARIAQRHGWLDDDFDRPAKR